MPPWRDGTTDLVMSPLEFMQQLGAQASKRLGLLPGLGRDPGASDWILPTCSDQRMSPKGRFVKFAVMGSGR